MEGKRAHDIHEETQQSESSPPKRIRLEEGEDAGGTSQKASSHDDDEEFTVESDSNSDRATSDSEEDFSDYKEEDEEDEDDVGETIIVKGVQGECKDNGEGKYRLHSIPNGRIIKIITDETNIQKAIVASSEKLKDCLIPVFKLAEVEISRDNGEELIIYARQLSLLDEDYPIYCGEKGEDADAEQQNVSGVLLKIENRDETFITMDLMEIKS